MHPIRLLTAAALACALALPAFAGDRPCPNTKGKDPGMENDRGPRMLEELNLTQDQKDKFKAEREQGREARKELFSKVKEIRDLARAELLKPQPSKNVLGGYAQKLADLHKKMMLLEYEHLLRVKAMLTPEQFEQLLNHEGRGAGEMHGKGDKDGEGCKKRHEGKPAPQPL